MDEITRVCGLYRNKYPHDRLLNGVSMMAHGGVAWLRLLPWSYEQLSRIRVFSKAGGKVFQG